MTTFTVAVVLVAAAVATFAAAAGSAPPDRAAAAAAGARPRAGKRPLSRATDAGREVLYCVMMHYAKNRRPLQQTIRLCAAAAILRAMTSSSSTAPEQLPGQLHAGASNTYYTDMVNTKYKGHDHDSLFTFEPHWGRRR